MKELKMCTCYFSKRVIYSFTSYHNHIQSRNKNSGNKLINKRETFKYRTNVSNFSKQNEQKEIIKASSEKDSKELTNPKILNDITLSSIEEKKKFINYFSNDYEEISSQSSKENDIIENQINEKLFSKIFDVKNKQQNSVKSIEEKENNITDVIKFEKSKDLLDSSKMYTTTIDRTLDTKQNREFSELILENKLDLKNAKLSIKSLNLKDMESTGLQDDNVPIELYEINFGKIKSFPNLKLGQILDEESLALLNKNSEYEYDVALLGKSIKSDEKINLNAYVALNEDDRHFISPVIFHEDPDAQKDSIALAEKETIFSYMLKNPFILFVFIIVGYYVYPNLWKKDYFMALSEDFNNVRHLRNKGGSETYDYINYRRGLYASVRSNFS